MQRATTLSKRGQATSGRRMDLALDRDLANQALLHGALFRSLAIHRRAARVKNDFHRNGFFWHFEPSLTVVRDSSILGPSGDVMTWRSNERCALHTGRQTGALALMGSRFVMALPRCTQG